MLTAAVQARGQDLWLAEHVYAQILSVVVQVEGNDRQENEPPPVCLAPASSEKSTACDRRVLTRQLVLALAASRLLVLVTLYLAIGFIFKYVSRDRKM